MDVKQRAANKPVDTNIPDYKKNPDDYNFNDEYYVVRPDIIGKTISMVFVKKSISLLTIGIVCVIPIGVVAIPSAA